ncbi:MAG: MFS transporter [Vicinamibacterales bacterium]
MPPTPASVDPRDDDRVYRAIFRRVVWFLFVLFVCSYLDRINIGFAALSMNKELGLSATAFGAANTVFYLGYMLFEIPSNLVLARVGARRWIARIMITWGLASTATMFASGAQSLYVLRLLVGIAEAGFMPGVLLYLTYWFPREYRARATALFMVAQPVTIAFGSIVSGTILQLDGALGLSGWRWLFLLEGLPSVVLGVATFFYLRDGPEDAEWLDESDKRLVRNRLLAERASRPASVGSRWRELARPEVALLCVSYFCLVCTLNTNATWVPQIVREMLGGGSFVTIGLVGAVPAVLTVIAMPLWSTRSDRRRERLWHLTVPVAMAMAGWGLVALSSVVLVRFAGLALVSVGAFSAMSIFWTLPASMLSVDARPAGIGLVSSLGILGSAVSPSIIGALRDATGSFVSGLLFMAVLLLVSIGCAWAAVHRAGTVAA